MSKIREIDILDATHKAMLTETKGAGSSGMVKAINVYNIPKAWLELIKTEGQTFSSFAKLAIKERLKREGLIE
jgi:hypothetical protein